MIRRPTSTHGVLLVVWIMAASSVFRSSSTNYVIGPAATAFGLGGDGTQTFKLIPSLGQLIVVFLAGLLAERFGPRLTLAWGASALALGGALCTISAGEVMMSIGLLVAAAGTSTLAVAGFALVGARFTGTAERARAFGVVATAMPLVSLIAPFICAGLSDNVSWRAITAIWMVLGVISLVGALRGLGRDDPSADREEYVTPLLAGMALAAFVQVMNGFSGDGTSAITVIYAAIAAASVLGIVVARRAMARTSLSFTPVRGRLPVLILLAVAVVAMSYQWYLGFLAFQYIQGLTETQIAVAMIPTQVLAIVAARLAPRVIVARGLRTMAVIGTLLISASCLLFLLVQSGQSTAVLATVMAVYGFISTGVGVAITNATMNAVPKRHSGAMASFRSASATLGQATSTVIMGALVFGVYGYSLQAGSTASGIDATTSASAAQLLNAGVNDVDVSSQMAIPTSEVDTIEALNVDALVDALHAKSIAAAAFCLVGAGLLAAALRRRSEEEDEPASVEATA